MNKNISELEIIKKLLSSRNPLIVFKTRVNILNESIDLPQIKKLQEKIKTSDIVKKLLSNRQKDGTIHTNPYKKWQGPLWTLVSLAHIDYPSGDESLFPIRDQVYNWLLSPEHLKYPRSLCIPGQEERFRRCAGQEGYAIWFTLKLGIADERTDILVERLKVWQWPDGGWNCDKRSEAKISSFHETFIPLQALALYCKMKKDKESLDVAKQASEVFLKRRLYKRESNGSIIHKDFTLLTHPYFYHYNILSGLKIMAEAGFLRDKRCSDALDLLESKRLPSGGFPLEKKIFKTTNEITTRGTFADWGPFGKGKVNEFVTVDALYVLKEVGRLG